MKSHEVMAKMKKVVSGWRGVVDLWSSFQKFSEFTTKYSNISVAIYLPKVNNRNNRTRYEICSKLIPHIFHTLL